MAKQTSTFPVQNINNPLSQYISGSFSEMFQNNKFSPSLKSKTQKDWSATKQQCDDFEWSQQQIITLLDFYSKYPQLWDTKHEQYMNKDVRKQLITTLSETVCAPEAAVNVKFQRLRVHFSRELRKEESSLNESQPYHSKWKYYRNMLFLKDTLRCRQKSRQNTNEKDSLTLTMGTPPSNDEHSVDTGDQCGENIGSHGDQSDGGNLVINTSSDSGHLSPDSTSFVSPTLCQSENKENISPIDGSRHPTSPVSPSLIPSLAPSSTLVPPLLSNNPVFSSSSFPAPPASLLSSLTSLEQLLSPRMLAPLLVKGGGGLEENQSANPIIKPGSLLAPKPQIPSSPLINAHIGSWPNREDEEALKSYQAKRQRLSKVSGEGMIPSFMTSSPGFMTSSTSPQVSSTTHNTGSSNGGGGGGCDYFSLHVSESLRRMDIICAEECKRAIQNTIYQYIVKSCHKRPGPGIPPHHFSGIPFRSHHAGDIPHNIQNHASALNAQFVTHANPRHAN